MMALVYTDFIDFIYGFENAFIILIANSPNSMQKILDEVVMKSKEKGLLLNVKKTECMTVSKNHNKALTLDLKSGREELKR